jgi:hypothetical protein
VIAADKRHRGELDAERVDAGGFRGVLVLAHRHEIRAEAARFEPLHDEKRDRHEREDDPVERRAALELKCLPAQVELHQGADAGAGDRRDARDDAQHFGEGEGDQREVRALQAGAEAQRAGDRAD